jgi:phenylacetate-coenzyme A ligase PaaK-like adenylate-forming protein
MYLHEKVETLPREELETLQAERLRSTLEQAGPAFMSQENIRGMEGLRKRIQRALADEILITPAVELTEYGSIPAGEGKAVRVVDNRPKEG